MGVIPGLLTTSQGSDLNLKTSIWQHIFTKIKTPYDVAAIAAGLNQGIIYNKDGSVTRTDDGLGIMDMEYDEDSLFKSSPNVGYELDEGMGNKAPMPTGCGDGANIEFRSVCMTCVPAIDLSSDGTQSTNKRAVAILRSAVWDAIGRQFKIDIVDSLQAPTNGLYPVIGYAEIIRPRIAKRPGYKDGMVIDRRDFKIEFELKFAVATLDGL